MLEWINPTIVLWESRTGLATAGKLKGDET